MPQSAKPTFEPIRKKMFSNAKLINNENCSRVNIAPGSPQHAFNESSKAYDQLKNKINNLEGRLVEIKKNFETSFSKKGEKKTFGKENDTARDKQKSKLVLHRDGDGKRETDKPHQREVSKGPEAPGRGKEGSMRRKTIQLKG